MQLDVKKFSKAAALTVGVVYLVCALLVILLPEFALQLLGWVTHLVNVDKFAGGVSITVGGLVAGFLQVIVYTYIGTALFASIFNKLSK